MLLPLPPAAPASGAWPDTALLRGQLAASSLAGYQQDLAAYLRFCGDPQRALEATSLARWRAHLAQETQASPHTINRRLAAVKRIVQEAAVQGYLDPRTAEAFRRVPGVPVKALKERLKVPLPMTPGQMRQLCEAPDRTTLRGWRDRALLATLAGSGGRISEILTLTVAQIQSAAGSFFVEVLGKNQTKLDLAPLTHEAYASIHAWLARRPLESLYVFTSFAGKGTRPTARRLHRSAAWRIVQGYARAVGLEHVTPHDFRRFVITETAKRFGIRVAQRVARHKRIETTAGYVLDELAGGLTEGLY